MPYGLSPNVGGDSEENDKWMEDCVTSVMKRGKMKGNAIAICKVALEKTKGNKSKAQFILSQDSIEDFLKLI